jgi:hypothetical protein
MLRGCLPGRPTLWASPLGVRDAGEIERDVGAFARPGNGGMIVTRIAETIAHRDAIIKAASKSRLPAVYPLRVFVTAGGLISYGPDVVDQYRRAAAYVDRILKGEKPADLPVVQLSTLLPSDARKRNVTVEIPRPACACRGLGRTLCGHSWFGHPHRKQPGHPERKEVEGQENDQAHI